MVDVAERLYGSPMAKLLGLRGASTLTRVVSGRDRQLGFWPSIKGMSDDQPPQGGLGKGLSSGIGGPGVVRTLR